MTHSKLEPRVTVVIPTAGEEQRYKSLRAAIDSIHSQVGIKTHVLVALNGNCYSERIRRELESDRSIGFEYIEKGSAPNARRHAIENIQTEYFAFLDDDDVYLDTGLNLKLEAIRKNGGYDVCAGTGFSRGLNSEDLTPFYSDLSRAENAPLETLIQFNWLASCGGLFRTATVDSSFFDPDQKYYEWTLLAFKLALAKRVCFVNQPTFIVNQTKGSLSQSEEYILELPRFLSRLEGIPNLPKPLKAQLSEKRTQSYNVLANFYFDEHRFALGLKYHFKCLIGKKGFLYFPLTFRYLFRMLS